MLLARAHRRLISEMVRPELRAMAEAVARQEASLAEIWAGLQPHDDQVQISAHTAELLDTYRDACSKDLGITLTREQALERLVQVFVGNPLAAREAKQGATNG